MCSGKFRKDGNQFSSGFGNHTTVPCTGITETLSSTGADYSIAPSREEWSAYWLVPTKSLQELKLLRSC
jgi:hypothetical protein